MNISTFVKRSALTFVLGVSCLMANAETFVYEGVIYKTGTGAKATELTVQKAGTKLTDTGATTIASYTGDIVIPAGFEYNGKTYKVVALGSAAFKDQVGVTSVSIPETVTKLPLGVCQGCSNLTKITLPATIVDFGSNCFANCTSLEELTVPAGVTKFDNKQIMGCTGLKKLVFADGEKEISIKAGAFGNYSQGSFAAGTSAWEVLSTVEVNRPMAVVTNAEQPFRNAKPLTTVVLGGHFNNVQSAMFQNSRKLSSLTITAPVTELGANAFEGTGLTEFIVPAGVKSIASSLFRNCTDLTKVTLHDGVTEIQAMAFQGSFLNDINLSDAITSIGAYAFENTRLAGDITLPASLEVLGNNAFANCRDITGITIPAGVASIGDAALYGCSSLAKISVAAENKAYASVADNILTDKAGKCVISIAPMGTVTELTGAYEELTKYAAYNITGLKKVDLPNCVKWGDYSLFGTGITELAVKGTVGRNVAASSASLAKLTISGQEVPEGIAANCGALTEVVLNDPVTNVKARAFNNCTSLKQIDLGPILAIIEADAFTGAGLETIITGAARPAATADGVFTSAFSGVTAKVPAAFAEAYRNATGWSFLNIVGDENIAAGPTDMGMPAGIYFAGEDGHIYAAYDKNRTEFTKYDVGGVPHTFQLREFSNRVYGASAGDKFVYSATAATEGDGKLFYISQLGGNVFQAVVLDNAGNNAYKDPFSLDVYNETLYVNDRNVAVLKIPANAISLPQDYPSWMENNWMGFYNNPWAYGCIKAGWSIISSDPANPEAEPEFWLGMKTNGQGIYRFKESNIGESVAKPGKKPENSEFLTGVNPIFTTFNIDEANHQMYIYIERIGTGADQIKAGLYRISLEDLIAFGTGSDVPTLKSKLQLIDGAPVKYEGSSTNEHVGISQLCFDENKQYMYWCYRAPSAEEAEKTEAQKEDDQLLGRYYWAEKFDAANPLHQSGIKRIKLGEANPVVEMVIPGAVGYGCVPVKFEGSDKPAGVNDIVADVNAADITVTADAIIANSDVTVKVYDMNGANVLSVSLRAGQSVATDGFGHGAFIAVANGAATKFVR